jgi:hypothetical protein
MLPDLASRMEEDFVLHQLRRLRIVFTKRRLKREMVITIPLTPNHEMNIRAVDVGPGGRKEFVTFVRVPKARIGGKITESAIRETIRAHVEITELTQTDNFIPFSYTLHEPDMETIIRASLEGAYHTRNLVLKPLSKRIAK